MACSSCKKKSLLEEKEEIISGFSNGVMWFAIIWSLLGLYGLYTLIKMFI